MYYYSQGWFGVEKAGKLAVLQQNQHGQQPTVSLLGLRDALHLHCLSENVTQICLEVEGEYGLPTILDS
jgi:hypothetical protein